MALFEPNASTTRWPSYRRASLLHLFVGLVAPSAFLLANMRRVHGHTADEAFVGFRYAYNFSSGHGLVYNVGDRVEGYASFLWTILLAIGHEFGADPETFAKILGAASALGLLWLVYRLSERMTPFTSAPCLATWFLASSAALGGHALGGTEFALLAFAVFLGTTMMIDEKQRPEAVPWSGLVFALAVLIRPEALVFFVAPMLLLGGRPWARRNLMRLALFLGPVALHLGFRLSYYGEWLPQPHLSRLDLSLDRIRQGLWYLDKYFDHPGIPTVLAAFLIVRGLIKRDRVVMSLTLSVTLYLVYVVLTGGDWMWRHRAMIPVEPFLFVLAGVSARQLMASRRSLVAGLTAGGSILALAWQINYLRTADDRTRNIEQVFWNDVSPRFTEYLIHNTAHGLLAMSDPGRVGYYTQYPVLDLLGDLDSSLSGLPNAYGAKTGSAYARAVLDARPEYVILEAGQTCQYIGNRRHGQILGHPGFLEAYEDVFFVQRGGRKTWCLYERRIPDPPVERVPPAPADALEVPSGS